MIESLDKFVDLSDPDITLPNMLHLFQTAERNRADCGLDNCLVSYGHDEYLYQVLKQANVNLPDPAFWIIRYHSLYAWHRDGCYQRLENPTDREMKHWVQKFSKYDLYSKSNKTYTCNEIQVLELYYKALIIKKYIPDTLKF